MIDRLRKQIQERLDHSGRYVAEVLIEPQVTFAALGTKLRELVQAVACGERPLLETW